MIKKFFVGLSVCVLPILGISKTVNLDKEDINIELVNNKMNLLIFPFIVHDAKLSTEAPEEFQVQTKNTTVMIVPTMLSEKQESDLLVWSTTGDAFLVKINGKGTNDQKFTFSSSKITVPANTAAKQFESGKIEQDIKNLIKKSSSGSTISGYKKIEVKRLFETRDLNMQKEYFLDGGKYRVEKWILENKTSETLSLDYENFYTNGVLAIAFEVRKLEPYQIGEMTLIINKSTIADQNKRNGE